MEYGLFVNGKLLTGGYTDPVFAYKGAIYAYEETGVFHEVRQSDEQLETLKIIESTRENPSKAVCECGNEVLLTLHNDGLEGVCECKKTYFIKINEGVWNCCSKSINTPID